MKDFKVFMLVSKASGSISYQKLINGRQESTFSDMNNALYQKKSGTLQKTLHY